MRSDDPRETLAADLEQPTPGAYPKINNTFARWIRGVERWINDSHLICVLAVFTIGITAAATGNSVAYAFGAVLVAVWSIVSITRSVIDALPYVRFSLRSLILAVLLSQIPILVLINAESDGVIFIGAVLLMTWICVVGTIVRFGIVSERIKEQRAIAKIELEQLVQNKTPTSGSA